MQSPMLSTTLAGLLALAALPTSVSAAEPAGNPPDGWSLYVQDVFDNDRTLGARRRIGERSAVNFAYAYRSSRYSGGYQDRRQQFTLGYRYLLGEGARRAFVDFEVVHAPGVDGDEDFHYRIYRAMVGLEYFFLPMFSIEGRAGVEQWRGYYDDGDSSRETVLPEVKLSINYHF